MPQEKIPDQGNEAPTGPDDLNALRDQLRDQRGELGTVLGGEEDVSGGVGALALSEEEQARLTALDDDPQHPRGNPELAQIMSIEVGPLVQVVENLKNSRLPNKEERAKDIETRGEELMLKARERYLVEEERYTTVRDHVLGSLLDSLSGGHGTSWILMTDEDLNSGNTGSVRANTGNDETTRMLSSANAARLRREIVALLGGNPEDDPNAQAVPASITLPQPSQTEIQSNISGVKASETLKFDDQQGHTIRHREFWVSHDAVK